MRLALLAVALAGCAAMPDHTAARGQVFNSTPVLCWVDTLTEFKAQNPALATQVSGELQSRRVACTAADVNAGRQMILDQGARERQMNAAAQAQNNAAVAQTIDGLLLLGAIAASQQRAAPINCYSQLGATYATTSCR